MITLKTKASAKTYRMGMGNDLRIFFIRRYFCDGLLFAMIKIEDWGVFFQWEGDETL